MSLDAARILLLKMLLSDQGVDNLKAASVFRRDRGDAV
jgi:hypothetical protein